MLRFCRVRWNEVLREPRPNRFIMTSKTIRSYVRALGGWGKHNYKPPGSPLGRLLSAVKNRFYSTTGNVEVTNSAAPDRSW